MKKTITQNKFFCLYINKYVDKVCPSGWRLPTIEEFNQLLSTYVEKNNTSALRDSSWQNGSNSSGFAALPAGYQDALGGLYGLGQSAFFWAYNSYGLDKSYRLQIDIDFTNVSYRSNDMAYSVRCIKKEEQ